MILLTEKIKKQLQGNFLKILFNDADYFELNVICKIFNPNFGWTWYLISQDPDDENYLFGIVDGCELEFGSFSKKDLEGKIHEMPFERDKFFEPTNVKEVFYSLQKGKHL
jgi:hypothetical protein